LYSLSNNKYLEKRERYLRHILLTNQIILITDHTVIFVKQNSFAEEWTIPIIKIQRIEYNANLNRENVIIHVDKLTIMERKTLSNVKSITINCMFDQKNIAPAVFKILRKLIKN